MTVDPPHPALRERPAGVPATDGIQRLADQLHSLSRVAETLTWRVLELEERLALQEARLRPLIEAAEATYSGAMEEMDLRLEDTESRLSRLEQVLHGSGADRSWTGADSSLTSLHADRGAGLAGDFDETAEPFPEEGEQSFLDEQVA